MVAPKWVKPSWNRVPFNSKADPETKAAEFDAQHAENKAEGDKRKREGKYPYDVDKRLEELRDE